MGGALLQPLRRAPPGRHDGETPPASTSATTLTWRAVSHEAESWSDVDWFLFRAQPNSASCIRTQLFLQLRETTIYMNWGTVFPPCRRSPPRSSEQQRRSTCAHPWRSLPLSTTAPPYSPAAASAGASSCTGGAPALVFPLCPWNGILWLVFSGPCQFGFIA
jgi:hypothetical protein